MYLHSHHLVELAEDYGQFDGLAVAIYLIVFGTIGITALIAAITTLKQQPLNRRANRLVVGLLSAITFTVALGSTCMIWGYATTPTFEDIEQAVSMDLAKRYDVSGVQAVLPDDQREHEALWVQRVIEPTDEVAEVTINTAQGQPLSYGVSLADNGQLMLLNLPDAAHHIPASVHASADATQPIYFIPRDYPEAETSGEH